MSAESESDAIGSVQFYSKKREHQREETKPDLQASSRSTVDPDVARQLFEEGAFLFFLDVPEKTEFGVDCMSWNVGEKFKGIKMIPPGIHFIYYSAVSKDNVTSPRTGFFHNFKSKEVMVRRWDPKNEGISTESVSEEEVERLSANLKNLDGYLGAYPYEIYKKWVSLTRWITDETVARLSPVGPNKLIFSVQQLESLAHVSSRSDADAPVKRLKTGSGSEIAVGLPDMKVIESTRIRFSDLSSRPFPGGAAPSDITRLFLDRSSTLEELILTKFSGREEEILGEVQFAFVCFLVGQVFDAFEQWKKMVALICTCEDSIRARPRLFLHFLSVFFFQFKEIPKDFFVDIVSQENFLTQTFQGFFAILENSEDVDAELRRKAVQFRIHLQKQFKWDFTTEVGEDAPVVVEDF